MSLGPLIRLIALGGLLTLPPVPALKTEAQGLHVSANGEQLLSVSFLSPTPAFTEFLACDESFLTGSMMA